MPKNLKQSVQYLDKECSELVKTKIKTIHEDSLIYAVYPFAKNEPYKNYKTIFNWTSDENGNPKITKYLENKGVYDYHSETLLYAFRLYLKNGKINEKEIINKLSANISNYDVVILSDYGKGVLTTKLTQEIISISNKNKVKVFVDPKGKDYSKYKGAYTLTPNKKEAIEASNILINDNESLEKAIKKLKEECELEVSLITLSESGIAIFDDNLRIKPTVAREVYDVTGAGDTVIASIAFAIANHMKIDDAIQFANLAAGVVVGKIGSATASLDEIYEYESSLNKSNSSSHIKSFEEIEILAKKLHDKRKKIIFTNGCFDILHAGHVKYLEEAKSYGDILILGLNADSSVRKLKGPTRPINNQDDRAYILASLESVDYVVIFEEETPYELIKLIQPRLLQR